jgi:hypothetical protein
VASGLFLYVLFRALPATDLPSSQSWIQSSSELGTFTLDDGPGIEHAQGSCFLMSFYSIIMYIYIIYVFIN